MWSYDINLMGPSSSWYEVEKIPYHLLEIIKEEKLKTSTLKIYNEQWYGGRIDCYCDNVNDVNYDKYGVELEFPIMTEDSYNKISEWLVTFHSKELLDFSDIKSIYEKETGLTLELYSNVKR